MEHKTDAELVRMARAGSKEAFGHLILRHQNTAYRLALRTIPNEAVAEEIAQQSMVEAYVCLGQLRDEERFRAWLVGIVLNLCRSYVRDNRGLITSWDALAERTPLDLIASAEEAPGPLEVVEAKEFRDEMLKALDVLSPKNRMVTLLFYYGQLSIQEIAATLGASVSAVKVRLHRARQQLKRRLLSAYAETYEGRKPMVRVAIADLVRTRDRAYVLVLFDEAGHRALPIWIGQHEAEAIILHLHGLSPTRPLTYELMDSLLRAVYTEVIEVRILAVKEGIFYAAVRLRADGKTVDVDARPSDAIAFALRAGSPIHVAEDVLEAQGILVPEEIAKIPDARRGVRAIWRQWMDEWRQAAQQTSAATEEVHADGNRRLIMQVFVGDE